MSAVTLCVLKTGIVSRLLRFLQANQKPVCFLGDFLPLPVRVLRSMETNAAWIEGSQAPAEVFLFASEGLKLTMCGFPFKSSIRLLIDVTGSGYSGRPA